jgi:hypothetical protein
MPNSIAPSARRSALDAIEIGCCADQSGLVPVMSQANWPASKASPACPHRPHAQQARAAAHVAVLDQLPGTPPEQQRPHQPVAQQQQQRQPAYATRGPACPARRRVPARGQDVRHHRRREDDREHEVQHLPGFVAEPQPPAEDRGDDDQQRRPEGDGAGLEQARPGERIPGAQGHAVAEQQERVQDDGGQRHEPHLRVELHQRVGAERARGGTQPRDQRELEDHQRQASKPVATLASRSNGRGASHGRSHHATPSGSSVRTT